MNGVPCLKENFMFAVMTILLVAVCAFCITGTVISQTDFAGQELESYYRERERELLNHTREQLESLGYTNSGVTLTRVVEEDGSREYTFTIHHRKIDRMTVEEREELSRKLSCETALPGACSFSHTFLMYD